jgi:hypothetical protein
MVNNPVAIGALKFVVKKHVTVPQLKIDATGTKPVYIRIESIIEDAKATGPTKKGADGQDIKPPRICRVTNLEDGLEMSLIANTVFEKELEDAYAGSGYVGKCFEVYKSASAGGKRYATFSITELEEVKEEAPKPTTVVTPAKK